MDSSKFIRRYFVTAPPIGAARIADMAFSGGLLYYYNGTTWIDIANNPNLNVGGDLSGTASNAEVIGIRTIPVSNVVPIAGDGLIYDGNEYVPTQISDPNVGGDLSGTASNATVIGLRGEPISIIAPVLGEALVYDGAEYVPTAISDPNVGGDLSGTASNATVIALQGNTVSANLPANNDVLTYSTGTGEWLPQAIPGFNSSYISISNVDSPYAAISGQLIDVDTSGGAVIVNLPAALTWANEEIAVCKTTPDNNVVTVVPNGVELINGQGSLMISYQWSSATLRSTGASVRIV